MWTGRLLLLASILGPVATVLQIVQAFDAVANDPDRPNTADLAVRINESLLPSLIAAPVALVAISIVTLGFILRRPENTPPPQSTEEH